MSWEGRGQGEGALSWTGLEKESLMPVLPQLGLSGTMDQAASTHYGGSGGGGEERESELAVSGVV